MKKWIKGMTGILSIVLVLTLMSSCKGDAVGDKEETTTISSEQGYDDLSLSDKTFKEMLEEYSESTLIDEVIKIESEDSQAIKYGEEELSFEEAVEKMDVISRISKDIKESVEETADLYGPSNTNFMELASSMTIEDAEVLLETYKTTTSEIEKARVVRQLKAYEGICDSWLEQYGLDISEELLKRSIKSIVCQESGLEPEYYESLTISGEKAALEEVFKPYATISGNDPVSGLKISYDIDDSSACEMITRLYEVQSAKSNNNTYNITDRCINTIDTVKEIMSSDFSVNEKNEIVVKTK